MNKYILFILIIYCNLVGCTHDKFELPVARTDYPDEIESLVIGKCAISGCHTTAGMFGAGGLDLSTWEKLFEGARGGAVVIPYRPDFSTFCYYTNTDTTKGLVLLPTMPYNNNPLTDSEYETIRFWVDKGAPNREDFVKFSDFEEKRKLYISNRGCDVVTVMDPKSGLAMRYINVGVSSDIEGPSVVKVSPDKKFWYVIFGQGTVIEKYRTADNSKVGAIQIGLGFWTDFEITSDSKKAFVSNEDYNGTILFVDLESLQVITTYTAGLRYPGGLCINNSNSRLYATSKEGNFIYKIDITNPGNPLIDTLSLETGIPASTDPTLNPNNILLSNDESMYFVTCVKTSELRVLNSANDSLIGIYATGSNPSGMEIANSYPYLFISCLGVPGTVKKSVINVFDMNAQIILPEIIAGHDSKGIELAEAENKLFVANRNVTEGGPASHHAPLCDGKNGYVTAIDLNTLTLLPDFKAELSVDPYDISK